MSNRNVDKGREAENAVAAVFQRLGMPGAERRAKRGGYMDLPDGQRVHRDAGDLAGIPGVVVQVKWSGYAPLLKDMLATDLQRQAAGAAIGLLVRKRPGVGLARAGEWDAYLPTWAVVDLLAPEAAWPVGSAVDPYAVWHTDLETAVRALASAGYGTPTD